jgi:hypothetical protein
VSRYNLSRSQKTVTVQDLYYGQMRVSGCKNHYKSVKGAGAKAKSVTIQLTHIVRVMRSNYLLSSTVFKPRVSPDGNIDKCVSLSITHLLKVSPEYFLDSKSVTNSVHGSVIVLSSRMPIAVKTFAFKDL